MKQERRKNEKGFTMVELIIVLAIMAILGAVLVPSFSKMTKKAQLTADLTTVKSLQRIVDVYYVDNGNIYPKGITFDSTTGKATGVTTSKDGKDTALEELQGALTVDDTYMKKGETITIKSGKLGYSTTKGHLCINVDSKYKDILKKEDQNVIDEWAINAVTP